ncbi:MAG: M6 family metalloprotease domain-containing protein [Gemmatimonadota bacterium]|nr:MAG: M6 family metalloprotease domain-containing protein [Gemmatimonadota bacterium]
MSRSQGPDRARYAPLLLLGALLVLPGTTVAQTDVELVGRMHGGAKPPAGYYEVLRHDPEAFRFSPDNGWIRRARAVARRRAEERAAMVRRSALLRGPGEAGAPSVRLSQAAAAWGPGSEVQGNLNVPVFLAAYANTPAGDTTGALSRDIMAYRLYGTHAAPPYSAYSYYQEVSGGRLFVNGTVLDWKQVSQNDTFYEGGEGCNGLCFSAQIDQLIVELLAAHDAAVDFGQFDNDGADGIPNSGDDDGYVDAVVVIHPEVDGSCHAVNGDAANNIWAHAWYLPATPATNDPRWGGGVIRLRDYIIQGGQGGDTGCVDDEPLAMGLIAHETGHLFDLSDLYNTNWDTRDSEGIGEWGLMGSGNWNEPNSPAHPTAWSRAQLGWITEVLIDRDTVLAVSPVAVSDTAYIIPIPNSNEFFLLANRQRLGSDVYLKGPGLLIWHVDSVLARQRGVPYANVVNGTDPEAVRLHQADGRDQLHAGTNRGDAGDPYPGSTANTRFSYDSDPPAARNDGTLVEVTLDSIAQVTPQGAVRVVIDLSSAPQLVGPGPSTLPPGVMGASYTHQFLAQGGLGQYSWTVVGGSLPVGLSLAAGGLVTGRPEEIGSFALTVRVTSGSQSVDQAVSLDVTEPVLQQDDILDQLFEVGAPLTTDEVFYLDLLGNRTGSLDVGDYLAWVEAGAASMTPAALAEALERAREGGR